MTNAGVWVVNGLYALLRLAALFLMIVVIGIVIGTPIGAIFGHGLHGRNRGSLQGRTQES